MKRLTILAAVLLSALAPVAAMPSSATARSPSVSSSPRLVAFRGFHLGGGGFGRSHIGLGGVRRRGSSHTFRRVAHALAFAYILHLFFSHGGLSILVWLLLIVLIVHFMRRRRSRNRYA
jgi:hypothetical protein